MDLRKRENDNRMKPHSAKKLLLLGVALILALTSCGVFREGAAWSISNTLLQPDNLYTPMKGVWEVTEIKPIGEEQTSLPAFVVGDKLNVDKAVVGIKDLFTVNPIYSAKYVNTVEYLTSRYLTAPTIEGFQGENIEVVMIRDRDTFTMDLMRITADRACFSYNSRMYYVKNVGASVEDDVIADYIAKHQLQSTQQMAGVATKNLSVLIGVKEKKTDYYGSEYYSYYTYLIRDEANQPRPRVYMMNNVLVPRGDLGFFFVTYSVLDKNSVTGVSRAQFAAYPTTVKPADTKNILIDAQKRSIDYIHDGTISMDKVNFLSALETKTLKAETVQMDNLSANAPMTMQQIGGPDAKVVYETQLNTNLEYLNISDVPSALAQLYDETNIGVQRTRMQWGFYSNLEIESGAKVHFQEFPLELIQQASVVYPDPLQISWTKVTARNAQANTAFTTPNKDRILIADDDEIQYFELEGDNIGFSPRLSIQMPNRNAQVIMVEYATDDTATMWETEFLKHETDQPQVLFGAPKVTSLMR